MSELLGGPGEVSALRAVVVKIGMLVVRGHPGTENEHVGLFHPTFLAFLRDRLDLRPAHQALVEAIATSSLNPESTQALVTVGV